MPRPYKALPEIGQHEKDLKTLGVSRGRGRKYEIQALHLIHSGSDRPAGPHLLIEMSAYLKMAFMLNAGNTEVAGFCVTTEKDPLHIIEFHTIKQEAWPAFVSMEGVDIANFIIKMKKGDRITNEDGTGSWVNGRNIESENCTRIWFHTHPGSSPLPSHHDEETVAVSFGDQNWLVMFIMDRHNNVYARLQNMKGVYIETQIPVCINVGSWPGYVRNFTEDFHKDVASWQTEYETNVTDMDAVEARKRREQVERHRSTSRIVNGRPRAIVTDLTSEEVKEQLTEALNKGQYADWDRPKEAPMPTTVETWLGQFPPDKSAWFLEQLAKFPKNTMHQWFQAFKTISKHYGRKEALGSQENLDPNVEYEGGDIENIAGVIAEAASLNVEEEVQEEVQEEVVEESAGGLLLEFDGEQIIDTKERIEMEVGL